MQGSFQIASLELFASCGAAQGLRFKLRSDEMLQGETEFGAYLRVRGKSPRACRSDNFHMSYNLNS